jgi:hypothetical protein
MALTKRGGKKGGGASDDGTTTTLTRTNYNFINRKDNGATAVMNMATTLCVAFGIAIIALYTLRDSSGGELSSPSGSSSSLLLSSTASASNNKREGNMQSSSRNGEKFVIDEEHGIELILNLRKSTSSSSSSIAGGPHTSTVTMTKRNSEGSSGCSSSSNVRFWLQYEGDAMGTVILTYTDAADTFTMGGNNNDDWNGEFSFPISGSYQLVSYFAGCREDDGVGGDIRNVARLVLKDGLNVVIDKIVESTINEESTSRTDPYLTSSLFPKASWIASNKLDISIDSKLMPYVWHDPSVAEARFIKTSKVSVSKEGATFAATGFFTFPKLSNYELVCWVGSQSASDSHEMFLNLRPNIASNQRPFKFHYYNSSSFLHPAADWSDDDERRFRKCKHILVSIDEIQKDPNSGKPITQQQYADQVSTFLHHVEKAFPDDTFPIWMFTVNESPIAPTACIEPYYLPRTSHHPCNDVLFHLFYNSDSTDRKKKSKRVHLLDNTMIALPQSMLQSAKDVVSKNVVTATIALRIFVFVGKKVKEWRDAGQHGAIDGLHRGENVEPNFELVPYTGWK